MRKTIFVTAIFALMLLAAACVSHPVEKQEPPPIAEEAYAPMPEPFPGKIAIITYEIRQSKSEEEYRSAQLMVAKYGEEKIIHKIWPVKFFEEGERMIRIVQQIAADPEVKALIINQCVHNSLAAVERLLEIRDDVFLVAIQPEEDPLEIAKKFALIINPDEVMMGYAMPPQAQKMGAKTFVHLSLQRHMGYEMISTRYGILEKECIKLGLDFVSYNVPEPTSVSMVQIMLEEILKLVAQHGEDTAFFSTACGLQIPLIRAVADAHAIYVQPCCPSPFHGFPQALGLISEGQSVFDAAGDQDAAKFMVEKTRERLAGKDMLGRVSTWPAPLSMMSTVAATEYAVKWINGEVPKEGIDYKVLEQCIADYAGVSVSARTLGSQEADSCISDVPFPNWVFVMMDYLTYE